MYLVVNTFNPYAYVVCVLKTLDKKTLSKYVILNLIIELNILGDS